MEKVQTLTEWENVYASAEERAKICEAASGDFRIRST
jgi:hypothetical protein